MTFSDERQSEFCSARLKMSSKQNPEISKSVSTGMEATDSKNVNGSSGQKQDPIERRRLQNRLSQRNHREFSENQLFIPPLTGYYRTQNSRPNR